MKFREFIRWCNERASDGCWGMLEAITCISIMQEVREQHFWKREKYWKEKYEKTVLNEIVDPIEKCLQKWKVRNEDRRSYLLLKGSE